MNKKEKTFDCLAYKDRAQGEIYEETKNLSNEELVKYFHDAVEKSPLAEFWKKIPKRNARTKRAA